jgi:competence ComEA-like helix-hairpin-helix protein
MPEDIKGNPLPDDQNEESGQENQENYIPDWMREAGWDESSGTFDESKPVFDDLDDEDAILPAEIPAWLEEAAPEGYNFNDASNPPLEFDEDESANQPIDEETERPDKTPEEPQDKTTLKGSTTPQEPGPAAADDEPGIPSWLKDLKLDEDSQETAIAWLENMPESLRATEEDLKPQPSDQPEITEEHVDDLAWMDELYTQEERIETAVEPAELSEDLIASDLIPEEQAGDKLFATEELRSKNDNVPDWLKELSTDEGAVVKSPTQDEAEPLDYDSARETIFGDEESPDTSQSTPGVLPDWLSGLDSEQPTRSPSTIEPSGEQAPEPTYEGEVPAWLNEFEKGVKTVEDQSDSASSSLDWLESLADEGKAAAEDLAPETTDSDFPFQPEATPTAEMVGGSDQSVSPNDDTLNTAFPDWLSNIGDAQGMEEVYEGSDRGEFEEPMTWLEQLGDQDQDLADQNEAPKDHEVLEWLDSMEITEAEEVIKESYPEEEPEPPQPASSFSQELETAKYLGIEEKGPESEDLPDWLDKLEEREQTEQPSLEEAIRQAGHPLSEEEKEFLSKSQERKTDNADWLAKLDQEEEQDGEELPTPAISLDIPPRQDEDQDAEDYREVSVSGGILDRLKDTGAISQEEPEIPQWLENLKKEEDPQETAILWLKQFVEKGDKADLNHEIKRYTDELNLGDSIPKWMEDLKKEEDPQTTAMLWLEKLSEERAQKSRPPAQSKETDESDWLSELDKEAAKKAQTPKAEREKDFVDNGEGWLADLEIDEKLKSSKEDLPEWSQHGGEAEPKEGDTPPWMKATSPLEGDFYTDELAGNTEKEVEIPAWLAGYGDEGEPQAAEEPPAAPEPVDTGQELDEYTWVPAGDDLPPKTAREPIDLNTAAISQLESILGISYQVAKGIVTYREKHGPYQEISDLMNVPEISDEQTIEILKPEVVIRVEKSQPKPSPAKKASKFDPEAALANARELMAEDQISEACNAYSSLIKKRVSLDEIIADLMQSAQDHPMNVEIVKTLGDAYMRSDDLDRALEAYSKAEELLS